MPATALPVVTGSRDGGVEVVEATSLLQPDTSNGNIVINGERMGLLVDNRSGAVDLDVTAVTAKTEDGLALANNGPHTVPAGDMYWFAFYPESTYNEQTGDDAGKITFTFSGGDSATRIAALALPTG